MHMDVTAPGRALAARFQLLGNMTGKTADEIIVVVGQPTSRSSIAHDQMLLQWQATGYHIALLFNAEGRLVKITHEFANYSAPPESLPGWAIGMCLFVGCIIAALIFAAEHC
jgi:hypothetical protein